MRSIYAFICAAAICSAAGLWGPGPEARAGLITVQYTVDAGGSNNSPLNGLAANATFETTGNNLSVLLVNTSSGLPAEFDAAASLLVSLGYNFPTGIVIVSGDSAVIGPSSFGLASWSARGVGGSVAEEWAWTNIGGGDLLSAYTQIITTSQGNHGLTRFDDGSGSIDGPWGGIAASPPLTNIPGSRKAVSNSVLFSLTLSGALTDAQLQSMANESMVEFGSDVRYLRVPEPASLVLVIGGMVGLFRRRIGRRCAG